MKPTGSNTPGGRLLHLLGPSRFFTSPSLPAVLGSGWGLGRNLRAPPRAGKGAEGDDKDQWLNGADDDLPPQLSGNWRDFRARLIQSSAVESTSPSSSTGPYDPGLPLYDPPPPAGGRGRISKANFAKLQMEDPDLAAEGLWCHELPGGPEPGGLIISTCSSASSPASSSEENATAAGRKKDERLEEVVAFLIEHGKQGSIALILNRPTALLMGKGGARGMPMDLLGAPSIVQAIFRDSRLYCGGFTAQHVIHVIHGHRLGGAHEVVPGIFMGGELTAAAEVEAGRLRAEGFRFFAGALVFEPGELQRQTEEGMWLAAACSRSLVLKQCIQLSTPLWKEVRMLMGGKHAPLGDDFQEGGSDSESEE